jgi:RHS repeat-associated protein
VDSRYGQPDSCSCFEPLEPRLLLSSSLVPAYNLSLDAPAHAACDPSLDSPHTQGIDILNQNGGGSGIVPGLFQDTGSVLPGGGAGVYLNSGEFFVHATDLEITGRGFDWTFERTYRSGVEYDGPLGHNWFLNYSQRLVVVTEDNQGQADPGFGTVAPGDVLRVDGYGRVDIYRSNGDGTYGAPAGYYTALSRREDGSFVERDRDGYVAEYAAPDGQSVSRLLSLGDRQGNTMTFQYDAQARLVTAIDTLGRPITYQYDGDRLDWVQDFIGRKISFSYDENGDLVAVTSPAVTGTPNGNDFPAGTTTGYAYSSGFADPRLNHNLLGITAPNEMASGGSPRIAVTYQSDLMSPDLDRVLGQSIGGTNGTGVPAGGAIVYSYLALGSAPAGDFITPVFQATVIDRNGNQARYQTNQLGNIVTVVEYTNRDLRSWEGDYTTRYEYNADSELLKEVLPEGNSVEEVYDSANPDRLQQGNVLSVTRWADASRGGDQGRIVTAWTYEPIYNQVRTSTDPRGYTTTFTFDYQEGGDYAGLAARLGTTEAEVVALLAQTPMNLGDMNGDGLTNQTCGNVVRIDRPTVNLLAGSNQAEIEGDTVQEIVELYAYNAFGQIVRQTDPEGNVDRYEYYSARDPDGDGMVDNPAGDAATGGYLKQTIRDDASAPGRDSDANPTPVGIRHLYRYDRVGNVIREVDGRGIATDYAVNQLNQVVQITRGAATDVYGPDPSEPLPLVRFEYLERLAYNANGNVVLRQVEDRGNTSGVEAYDPPLGGDANLDGRVDDSDLSIVLTYLGMASGATWRQGDFDGDGAVDNVDFTLLLINFGASNPPAFVDTQYQYDILDRLLRTEEEVKAGDSLVTRYRYDSNGHLVLTILPEGNATTSCYDERDLLYWSVVGATVSPPLVLLAVGESTGYDVRGGIPSQSTCHYDGNGNLIESVDPADTDLSAANDSDLGGPGDRTRYIYDGFDRRTSLVDSVGNQTVWQYDPAGNVVRESHFGPTGGPSPTSDGPDALPRPVSSNGVIQIGNLVNGNLLSATEYRYDELGRMSQTEQVLLVNTIPTVRPPDVRAGASDLGKGDLAEDVAPRQPAAAPGTGTGLLGTYYDNGGDPATNFTGPSVSFIDPTVNFYWGTDSPAPGIAPDTFSVRWTGQVEAQYTEPYTFFALTDDGSALYVDGRLIINDPTYHGADPWNEKSGTIYLVAGQKYDIRFDVFQSGGDAAAMLSWSSPSTPKEIIPQSQLFPAAPAPVKEPQGLLGIYFDNGGDPTLATNFTGEIISRVDPRVDFDWGWGSPHPAMGPDNFSVRWIGQVEAPVSGTYTFYTLTDDGAALWVNGVLIINDPTFHSADPWNEKSGTIDLEAGKKYDIRFEMFDGGGGAVARLRWSTPSLSKETIPQSRLFLPVYAGAPDAPTGLAATNVGAYAIDLAWTDSTADRIGYTILRSPTGAVGSFVEVAQVAANSYRDEVLPGTTYYYQVVAFNLAGDSVPSNTLGVTSPASTLPVFWRPSDVGNPGQAGTAAYDAATSTFTIEGGGADIWGDADQFYYVYQTMTGDGTITVRVVSQEDTDWWAKAGLMIRETLDAGSRHAMVAVTPWNGLTFQGRDWPCGGSFSDTNTGGGNNTPCYLRLTRRGDVFTAYTSPDGITFTQLGNPRTIYMGADVLVGLAVTAHNNSTLGTAVFDNVSVVSGRILTRYEYDRGSRLTFTVEDDGDTSRTFYDGAGRAIETLDPEGNVVEYAYDRNSNLIETRRTDVAQVAGVPDEVFLTTFFYDSLDRLQRKVDNLGGTFEYRYDSRNNLVAMADAQGPLSSATVERRAFAGGTLTASALNGPGNVTLRFYDGQSRLVREETILTASGSGDGIHVGATLEGTKTDPPPPDTSQGGGDGIIRRGRSYDDNSLPSAEIDDDGNVTLYLYDNLSRRVAETKGLTTGSGPLDKFAILGLREIVTPTVLTLDDPAYISADKINAQLAGAEARLDEVAPLFPALAGRVDDQPPTTIIYGYDQDGNLLLLEDENDTEVFGRFDAVNRRIATRAFRSGQTDSFAGDPLFAPNPASDPSNPSTAFPPVIGTTRQDFQYDGLSRLTWATDNNDPSDAADDSAVTRAYDSLGRVIEEAQQIGLLSPGVVSSAWRAGNLRSALTYPNGRVVRFTYDVLDRLDTVTDQGASAAIADYDWIGADRVLRRSSPLTGTCMTYLDDTGAIDIGYDGLGRTVQLRDLRSDDSLIVGFTYTYDRMGNKLTEGKLHDPVNSEAYAYDSAYRMVGFDRPDPGAIAPLQSDWVLDGAGNWDQVDGETREHSSINEITERTAGGTATPVLSDDNGNEIDDGTFTYEWDLRNRLRRATRKSDGQAVGVYSYDALDRRIRTVVTQSPPVTTDVYYDGQREIEERGGGILTQQYVYGAYIDEPLALDLNEDGDHTATGPGDSRLAYHQNALFSVYALTNMSGAIKEGYLYDAYGKHTVFQHGPNGVVDWGGDDAITPGGASGPGNPHMFTGRRLDAETLLYYYRNRYYNADQGRFISRDKLAFRPYLTEITEMDLAPGGPRIPGRRPQPQSPESPRAAPAPPSEPLPRALVPAQPKVWAPGGPIHGGRPVPMPQPRAPALGGPIPGGRPVPMPQGMNLYEYGRGNPGRYTDPLGWEATEIKVTDLAKVLMQWAPVKSEIDKAKGELKEFGLGLWNSMPWWGQCLTLLSAAAAARQWYSDTGSFGGSFGLLSGPNLSLSLSLTLTKETTEGPGNSINLGVGLKF